MYHYVTLVSRQSRPTTLIPNPDPEAATVDSARPSPGPRQTPSGLLCPKPTTIILHLDGNDYKRALAIINDYRFQTSSICMPNVSRFKRRPEKQRWVK